MAMEANAASMPAVKPLQRPQSAGNTGAVTRRDGGSSSSPFAPQTNVTIRNSIADMAGVLAKISTNENMTAEEIPQQVQKLVQNVLSSAFSLDATLAEGLGSTMESQRFSMEQLTTLSRLLSQMGTLSENGAMGELSDSLQALLQNIKSYAGDGNSLEPVLLNKLAFQLLDTKSAEDLPAALQLLMGQMAGSAGAGTSLNSTQSESLGFLKQLMQYFMPAAAGSSAAGTAGSESSAAAQGKGTTANMAANTGLPTGNAASETAGNTAQSTGSTSQAGQPAGTAGSSSPAATGNAATGNASQPTTGQSAAAGQTPAGGQTAEGPAGQAVPGGQSGNTAETMAAAGKQAAAPNTAGQPQAAAPGQSGTGSNATNGANTANTANTNTATTANTAAQAESAAPGTTTAGNPAAQANAARATAQAPEQPVNQPAAGQPSSAAPGSQQAAEVPLQNTSQTMDVMKSLASLLLKDASLTEKDATLLQNFVNGTQGQLTEKDAKQLQLLLRLCQHNMPAAVQQAANQPQMDGLPKLWAFMQLCELTTLQELKSRELKTAGKRLAEFTSSIKHSMGGENSQVEGQRSMRFMMPLYMGDSGKSLPAYIHVYDEEKQPEEGGEPQKETWLRLCVLTENIGAVELTCRLYENQKLNLRVFFSDPSAVQDFQAYVPELKETLQESPLELTDLKVGAAGGRL